MPALALRPPRALAPPLVPEVAARRSQLLLDLRPRGARARAAATRCCTWCEHDLGFLLYRAVERAKRELSRAADEPRPLRDTTARDRRARSRARSSRRWIARRARGDRALRRRRCWRTRACTAPAAVDRVFLTGGSSLVPAVRALFEARFGAEKLRSGGRAHLGRERARAARGRGPGSELSRALTAYENPFPKLGSLARGEPRRIAAALAEHPGAVRHPGQHHHLAERHPVPRQGGAGERRVRSRGSRPCAARRRRSRRQPLASRRSRPAPTRARNAARGSPPGILEALGAGLPVLVAAPGRAPGSPRR